MPPLSSIDWPALPPQPKSNQQKQHIEHARTIRRAFRQASHFESPYPYEHQFGKVGVGYAAVVKQGILRRRILERLDQDEEKAIPAEIQLEIFGHLFRRWRYRWCTDDFDDMTTTIDHLFAGTTLPILRQVALSALRDNASFYYQGGFVRRFDAIELIDVFTQSHTLRNELVNIELDLPIVFLTDDLDRIHMYGNPLADTYQDPAAAATILTHLPKFRRLTVRISGPDVWKLGTRLDMLHGGTSSPLLATLLLGLEALVVHKSVQVEIQMCLEESRRKRYKIHTVWKSKLGDGRSVEDLCSDMIELARNMNEHTCERVWYEEGETDRIMSD